LFSGQLRAEAGEASFSFPLRLQVLLKKERKKTKKNKRKQRKKRKKSKR
jgi:hypothetical protein